MIINVSPLEYGHVLIVPDIDAFFPQILTQFAIKTGLDCILLSSHRWVLFSSKYDSDSQLTIIDLKLNVDPVFFSRGFKVGFNSLCAFASVNHLHLHAYYLEQDLFVDNCVRQLKLAGDCSSYFFPFYIS